jgi:hypothetical protein
MTRSLTELGNLFADLGSPDTVEHQAKLRLAYALKQIARQADALSGSRCHGARGVVGQAVPTGPWRPNEPG